MTGDVDDLVRFEELLRPFGLIEMVKTGVVALSRGASDHIASSGGRHDTPPTYDPGAPMFYDDDADLDLLRGKTVAVIGFGSQGHAHALNLHESGVKVVVGLRPESARAAQARSHGLEVLTPSRSRGRR